MGKEVAVKEETSTAVAMFMEDDAGAGFENVGAENKSIPYLSLAQALSDKVKRGPDKVEGLEEGDFLNTATMEIYKPGTFRVVPCAFQMRWVEKDGKGKDARIVTVHETKDAEKGCTKDDKGKLQNAAGNYIFPTAMHFVLVVKADGSFAPAVVSLANSQLRRSKNWLSLMESRPKIQTKTRGFQPPAMFAYSYAVNSLPTKNAEGSWMLWDFAAPEMLTSAEIYQTAKAFHEEIKKGLVKVADPVVDEGTADAGESKHF